MLVKPEKFNSSMRGTSPSFHAKDGLNREVAALMCICGSLRLLRGPVFYPGTVLGVDQQSNVANFQSPTLSPHWPKAFEGSFWAL